MSDSDTPRCQFSAQVKSVSIKRRLLRSTSSNLGGLGTKSASHVEGRRRQGWARIATVGIVLLVALFAVTAVVGAAGNMQTPPPSAPSGDLISGEPVLLNSEGGQIMVSGFVQELLLLADQLVSASDGMAPDAFLEDGCTYGKGYWKNHPAEWLDTELSLGGVISDQVELLDILGTPPRGDATYILAGQLIAAKLNVLAGADSPAIDATINEADAWLVTNPLGSDPEGTIRQDGIDLAETLDDYNNGVSVPGSCDDEEPGAAMSETTAITSTIRGTTVVTDCTGANPHPHATTMAAGYRVPYDEIMGWKCSGFGFGEIMHAYALSATSTLSASAIIELRDLGYGWGQIRKMVLDGELEEGDPVGFEPGNNDQDKSKGKKVKGDKVQGQHVQAQSGQAQNSHDPSGQETNGQGNHGQGNHGQGDNGQGNNGQGNNGGGNNGQGNSGHGH
jgi:hypothetical protein